MSESSETPRPFLPGDVVRLRSGGPKMTVHGPVVQIKAISDTPKREPDEGGAQLHCLWFDETGHLRHGSFPTKALLWAPVEDYD